MDWNPRIEQELQSIPKNYASHNPQEQEHGYRAQQPQMPQNQYSTLYMQEPISQYIPRISFGERLGAFISYLFVWPSGFVFFLFAEKQNRFVRFHALQSMLFFGSLSIAGFGVDSFIRFINRIGYDGYDIPFIGVIVDMAWVVLILLFIIAITGWFMGMIHALRGRYYKMPFVGDLVERFMNRQGFPK